MAQGIVDEFVKEYKQEHQGRQFSERYWYPNMLKGEIAEVKSLAEQEATTTDNYLGIGVKWLYNNQKGHGYFALYSTEDEKGSTVLYACKDDSAEFEYKLLLDTIALEDSLHESIDTGSNPIGRILNRVANASDREASNHIGTVGTGSNDGDAPVHSRNKRKRPNKAFLNCLKNIAEVQSRYGVDDHYLFAVERGDMKTAQQMVDEAAKMAGYAVKAYHGTPIKGITVFDTAKIGSTTDDGIFGHGFYFTTNKLTADGYATVNGETMPVFLRIENPWWGLGHKIDDVAKELGLSKEILTTRRVSDRASVVAPLSKYSRIFTSHLMDNGYDSVIVQHGKHNYELVVFDNTRIKSADPVTYDDNGNVIPLSVRFNPEKKDIRYQDRSSAPVTNRTLMANALESTAQHELEHSNYTAVQIIRIMRFVHSCFVLSDSVLKNLIFIETCRNQLCILRKYDKMPYNQ